MSRPRAFGWILLCYAFALLVGVGAWFATPDLAPFARVAVADVAATVAVFLFSRMFNNSSFYDAYWSVAPMVMAPALALSAGASGVPGRVVVVVALVQVWGARLTLNWARGWGGLDHEDWRYVHFRRTMGRAYWLVSLTGIHLFPTAQVLMGCLALQSALIEPGRPLGWLDAVAALVTGGAIALEAVADQQLRAFRRSQPPAGSILQTGLWSRMRHPNYTGEMGFWWGLWLFGVAAVPGAWWWTLAGPVAMTLMFAFVSIPLIDRRHLERRPAYAAHKKAVPALIPLPGRVAGGD